MIDEIWKSAVGYEGFYDVSDQGQVRSLARRVPYKRNPGSHTKLVPSKILKQSMSGRYLRAVFSVRGERYNISVHRVMLETFVGPCPDGMEGCHNNGIKSYNVLSNLRWDTPKNNSADRVLHGTHVTGEGKKGAKLTDDAVRDIRSSGMSGAALARIYNVSRSCISSARMRKTWTHIA